MKILLAACLSLSSLVGLAADDPAALSVAVEYLNSNSVVRTPQDFAFAWDGTNLVLSEWRLAPPKPTIPQLRAVVAQAAVWKAAKELDEKATVDLYDERLKAVVKALVKCINLRLPADKRITADELKAAIKEEL